MKLKNVSYVATAVAFMIGSGALADTISINSCGANLTNAPVIFNSYERPVVLQQAAVVAAPACAAPAVVAAPACAAPVVLQQAAVVPAQPVGILRRARRWFELSVLGMGISAGPRRGARVIAPAIVEQPLVQPAIVERASCSPAIVSGTSCQSAVVNRTLMQPALIDRACEMNSKTLYDYPITVPTAAQTVVQEQIVQPAVVEQQACPKPEAKTIMLHDTETTVKKTVTHTMQRVYRTQAIKKHVAKKHCARQVRRRPCDMGS